MSDVSLNQRNLGSLIAFVVLVLGTGMAIGAATGPDAWFASLAKPSFNPPNWLFAPVWTVLYVMVGVAGWLMWRRDRSGPAMKLWWAQLALNFLWTPIFFTQHRIAYRCRLREGGTARNSVDAGLPLGRAPAGFWVVVRCAARPASGK